MSSSGILTVNSGPLIIRTYLDGSSNNSYVLGQYDTPVSGGSILTTSTNGLLVPSNNVNISSISVSTLSSNTISTGLINGVVPISSGTYYSDYLFWNNTANKWDIGNSTIHIGSFAGSTSQGQYSIAIGYYAGLSSQNTSSIAIGTNAGSFSQSTLAIAIGNNAGNTGQQAKAIAIGNYTATNNQSIAAIAIGDFSAQVNQGYCGIAIGTVAGTYNQSTFAIAIGTNAGTYYQSTNAIAIGTYAGSTSQGQNSIAIGSYAGQLNQSSNTIILNASGINVSSVSSSAFYVNPIRNDTTPGISTLQYNINTSEITYSNKTFVIQHPSKQDNYLVHACLEGPESGVYYRGTVIVLGRFVEVELPDYVTALADNFTVNVTHVYDEVNDTECKTYSATRVKNGRFRIYGPCGTVDWVVFGKRAGIEVEPLKSAVNVKGEGPYKWALSTF